MFFLLNMGDFPASHVSFHGCKKTGKNTSRYWAIAWDSVARGHGGIGKCLGRKDEIWMNITCISIQWIYTYIYIHYDICVYCLFQYSIALTYIHTYIYICICTVAKSMVPQTSWVLFLKIHTQRFNDAGHFKHFGSFLGNFFNQEQRVDADFGLTWSNKTWTFNNNLSRGHPTWWFRESGNPPPQMVLIQVRPVRLCWGCGRAGQTKMVGLNSG